MKIVVDKENIRLDKYISDNTEYSRSKVDKMIDDGFVLVNGSIAKQSYKTEVNDEIDIDENYEKEIVLEKKEMKLDIVYEDEYLIVLNKPTGLVVHPGSGNRKDTLVNGLLYYCDSLSQTGGSDRAGIVHRLDKDTSGLMLVAKTDKAHEILSDMFKNKMVSREYIALISGVFPSQTAKINAPIGKSSKDFRMQEVKDGGKVAVTNLWVLNRYKKHTLVRLALETGRTHQIRVHLNYIGYPVFNDPVYSKNKCTEFGQFLHSFKIKFNHPITGKEMYFESELPTEFQEFIDKLD